MITYPLNNIDYTAEDAELFHCTRNSGIWAKDSFSISVTGFDNNIAIGTGIAWINNEKFSGKVVALKSAKILDLGIADSAYPRIDVIAIQFNANNNATDIVVKKGVASTNPTRPAISRTATVYELYLASIYRPAASTVVTANNVTDLRLDESVCGLMSDSVTKIDTGAINAQVLALIGSLNAAIESVKNETGVMLTADYDPDNNRVFAISNGGTGATSAAGARTNLGLDRKLFTQYALNSINIDSTNGNWTVDISESGHGTVPEVFVNVTQTSGNEFLVQTAIKCNPSASSTHFDRDNKMWVRDRYKTGVWSNWKEVLTENRGVQMVKLWERESNSVSSEAGAIDLLPANSSEYEFIEMVYESDYGGYPYSIKLPIGHKRRKGFDRTSGRMSVEVDSVKFHRDCGFIRSTGKLQIDPAFDADGKQNNLFVIPIVIYGIKGVQ